MTGLSETVIGYFDKRGIDAETLDRYGVASATRVPPGDTEPCQVIIFPVVDGGEVVNHKYRTGDKRFWQDANAHKTFWNADVLADPALSREDGPWPLVITEGEIDALSAIEAGCSLVVSVPDGAPKQVSDDPVDPTDDKKFEYIWNNRERLSHVQRFTLATDNDGPGLALREELARRLGKARCSFVEYPEDCKDLNDVLVKHGQSEVVRCLTEARPYPVKGLYTLDEYPDIPAPQTYEPAPGHWPEFGSLFRPFLGSLCVVTGIPGHGKSTFVIALCYHLARAYGFVCTLATFENDPVPFVRDTLRNMHGGKAPRYLNAPEVASADEFIRKQFVFVGSDPRGEDEDTIDLEWLLERMEESVVRHGARIIMIDPWNMIEHRRRRGEEQMEYIERALRAIRRFAKSFGCLVFLIAHPTKDVRNRDGSLRAPDIYDISGSADWYNKPDFAFVVWRPDKALSTTEIRMKKVRFQPSSGKEGVAVMMFDQGRQSYQEVPDEVLEHAS